MLKAIFYPKNADKSFVFIAPHEPQNRISKLICQLLSVNYGRNGLIKSTPWKPANPILTFFYYFKREVQLNFCPRVDAAARPSSFGTNRFCNYVGT
jgi:hypothetical protein